MSNRGITLVELLTSIALIGALLALVAPALQVAREAARRAGCLNNQRQIGIALNRYHAEHGAYPVGCDQWRPWGGTAQRQLAWSAFLLPQLEQASVADQLHYDLPFDHPANAAAAAVRLPVFLCPSAVLFDLPDGTARGPSHYGGMFGERITGPNSPAKGVLLIDQPVRLAEIDDGAACTLIVGEDTQFPDGQWINGRNLFDQAFAINAAPRWENDLRSDHPRGAVALTCSGAAHFISDDVDPIVLAAWCTRAGGEMTEMRP